jgi:hypothetical protein
MRSHLWRRLVIVCFWIVGLLSAVAVGYAWGDSQQVSSRLVVRQGLLSGADIGFRWVGYEEDARRGTRVVGHWLVRIDGEWIEVAGQPRVMPAK